MRVDPATLDQAYGLLNCANGTVDLATGDLLAHDPAHLFTLVTEVDYEPGATSKDWDKAREAFADADSEAWIQRHFGGALTGLPGRNDVMAIHHGQGANGKSTILGTVQAAFGEFAGLLNDRILVGGTNEHQTIYMELRGKRLMVLEELPESHMLPIDRIKKLVDTPSITARGIGENPTTFPATHTLVISSNYVPVVRETDHGTWRRLVMIDYPHTFTGKGVDKTLRARLRKPAALKACLAWLVEGSVAWHAEGQGVPDASDAIETATRAWRHDADVLGEYLAERFEPGSGHDVVTLQAVYQGFSNYQENHGERPWSYKLFAQRLRGHRWIAENGAEVSPRGERWPGFTGTVRLLKRVKRRP
jgi:putative DNA primase/helicase